MLEPLNVYRSGRLIGRLDMYESEAFYGFTYDEQYLSSSDSAPLSVSLPLSSRRYSGAETLPYFEGLLPEGSVRDEVARRFHVSGNSPAKLISVLGRDCAGDVSVVELDDPAQPPAVGDYEPLPDALRQIAQQPLRQVSQLRSEYRLSLAGGQEKVALYHDEGKPLDDGWFAPLNGSPSNRILKPQVSDRYPDLALNEFLCMKAAAYIGIDAARISFFADGQSEAVGPMVVVERYDRVAGRGATDDGLALLRRVHQEDFCQALGLDSDGKYEAEGTFYIRDMARILMEYADIPHASMTDLYTRLLFNYLIGNCDAHLKNYSVLWEARDCVRLAPAYDLLSTSIYDGAFGGKLSRSMGLRLGRHVNIDKVDAEDILQVAKELRQPLKTARAIAGRLADDLAGAFDKAVSDLTASCSGWPNEAEQLAARIVKDAEKRQAVLRGL
jgi:serine/threonine-protein kinase HipA